MTATIIRLSARRSPAPVTLDAAVAQYLTAYAALVCALNREVFRALGMVDNTDARPIDTEGPGAA